MCKGTMGDGFSTFTVDMDKYIVIVKNVPAYICDQCGDTCYSHETARFLEEIVYAVTEPVSTEITVVSYTERVA